MRAGQSVFVAIIPMDVELAKPVHAFQLFEAVQWDFASTSDKL